MCSIQNFRIDSVSLADPGDTKFRVQKFPDVNLFIKPLDSVPANEKPQSVSIKYCVAKQQMRRYTIFFDQEGKRSAD